MDLVIFAHPDNKGSHNAAVLKYVRSRLTANRREFEIIDLYAERFDPLIRTVNFDMPGDYEGVKAYQEKIKKAERLIFIYPVWFYNMPAIMKGFCDRVFSSGFAYDFSFGKDGKPALTRKLEDKTAVVINTFGHGEEMFMKRGAIAAEVLDKLVLDFCGIKSKRVNWFSVKGAPILPGEIARKIDAALE
jgi:NAD(P)H dehydrogenase (quinone)